MTTLIGRKVGMTQNFGSEGQLTPLTVVQAGPCRVLTYRTQEKDGYEAAVVGFEEVAGSKLTNKNQAELGFFKKLGSPVYRTVREFSQRAAEPGSDLTVEQLQAGDRVEVRAVSKGKGWAGAIRRWNFSRGRETHGGKFNRALGSTGQNTEPARVMKGTKMSGRLGGESIYLRSVVVVDVIPEENLLVLKGPIPGGKGNLITIKKRETSKK